MKIILIGTAHPYRGGIAAFNERLAQELIAEGHEVKIYSFSLQYPNILFPGKSQYTDDAAPNNLEIISAINSINPFNWWRIGKRIGGESADLILVRFWLPFFGPAFGTVLRQVNKNKHTKIISIVDNIIPHEQRIGDRPLTKYFLKPIDAFVAMSKDVLQDLKTFTTEKPARFSPHPIYDIYGEAVDRHIALEKLKLPMEHKYILFFGFIRKYKGLDILLEAMRDLRFKDQHIHLIVAGEYYGDEAYYNDIMKDHPNSDKIHFFTTFIPNDEVKYYFSAADVVVQPYRTATQSGISQIAYHFNKPMIVTNVGGLPEIVPHTKVGLVTEVSNEAIADAVLEIFNNDALETYKQGVMEEKEKYSWRSFTDTIYSLYNKLK